MDGDSPHRGLIGIAIGHQFLQLQSPASDETECGAHGGGAVHGSLPERAERVGVVKRDAPLLEVETHAQPRRERVGHAGRRRGAVGEAGLSAVGVCVMGAGGGGQVDLAHAHREERKRRRGIGRVFCPAVMAAVRIIPVRQKTSGVFGLTDFFRPTCSYRGLAMS